MKIETAVVTIKGVKLALAFPDSSYVQSGEGDTLIARLAPYFPALPVMLVTFEDGERAYAGFQYEPIFRELNLDDISLTEIDLDTPPPDDSKLPF